MSQKKYEAIRKIRDDLEVFLDGSLKEDVGVVLPENMSKTFFLSHKPAEVAEVKWLSGCYHIIHTILELSFDKRYLKGKRGSYVPLDSKILRRVCGTFYKPLFIENLIRLKIIECDGKYSKVKHNSLGYRLTKKYRGQPLKNRTIQDPGIKKAIIRHREERLSRTKETHPSHCTSCTVGYR